MAKQNQTKKQTDNQKQQLSSQDPAEGRPDVPQGKGADKGRKYDTDKHYQPDEQTQSTDQPAEGRRDVGGVTTS
jgi:hypothetical protein